MSLNGRKEPATVTADYYVNRSNFPTKELWKHIGKHVAFSLDGTRILASGCTIEEVEKDLVAAGIDPAQTVGSFVDDPDIGWI